MFLNLDTSITKQSFHPEFQSVDSSTDLVCGAIFQSMVRILFQDSVNPGDYDFTQSDVRENNSIFSENATQNLVENIKQETKNAFDKTIENVQEFKYWNKRTQNNNVSVSFETGDNMYVFYSIKLNVNSDKTSGNSHQTSEKTHAIENVFDNIDSTKLYPTEFVLGWSVETNVSGVAIDGYISDGSGTLFEFDENTFEFVGGNFTTNSNGTFDLSKYENYVSDASGGFFKIEITGGTDIVLNVPNTLTLTAIVEGLYGNIVVTPITSIAATAVENSTEINSTVLQTTMARVEEFCGLEPGEGTVDFIEKENVNVTKARYYCFNYCQNAKYIGQYE